MNASASTSSPAETSPTPPATKKSANAINPFAAFIAFSHPARWESLKIMATGKAVTAGDVTQFASSVDMMRKHLRVLADAGVVSVSRAEDGRMPSYSVPPEFRPQPGLLDYGFCVVRFA
jgi:hypothetical protein